MYRDPMAPFPLQRIFLQRLQTEQRILFWCTQKFWFTLHYYPPTSGKETTKLSLEKLLVNLDVSTHAQGSVLPLSVPVRHTPAYLDTSLPIYLALVYPQMKTWLCSLFSLLKKVEILGWLFLSSCQIRHLHFGFDLLANRITASDIWLGNLEGRMLQKVK